MRSPLDVWVDARGSSQYAGDVIMERHRNAEPGYWLVTLLPQPPITMFFGMTGQCPVVSAVVDDYGHLVAVEAQA